MNKHGVAFILSYAVIAVLTILGSGLITVSVFERNNSQRYADSVDAFWLAEAGISRALNELESDFSVSGDDLWSGSLNQGSYSVDVEIVGQKRKVTSHGFVPISGSTFTERIVEAIISGGTPDDFFDYAIYSAGDIDFNGSSYSVDGDVLYADHSDVEHPEYITGTTVNDEEATPLPYLDFEELLEVSEGQGNVYDVIRLHDVQTGADSFPDSFWYSQPSDPSDPTTGIPNVVYVDGDLQLNGNIGTIGGYFVVVGDVITDPNNTEDMSINGNGQIDGVIYSRGVFRINGGAGGLNVNGSVWAGEEARLNGNSHVAYNPYFVQAIEGLGAHLIVRIVSWRDTQNPFKVSP